MKLFEHIGGNEFKVVPEMVGEPPVIGKKLFNVKFTVKLKGGLVQPYPVESRGVMADDEQDAIRIATLPYDKTKIELSDPIASFIKDVDNSDVDAHSAKITAFAKSMDQDRQRGWSTD